MCSDEAVKTPGLIEQVGLAKRAIDRQAYIDKGDVVRRGARN